MVADEKVSVIIPFHNSGLSLGGCLESVFQQTYKNLEVIVVDDGSTDDPESILAPFRDRIKLLRQSNQGQGAARNLGLENATGTYVAFLDADDEFKPDFAATCVDFLQRHTSCVAVNTAFAVLQPDGQEVVKPQLAESDQPEKNERVLDDFFQFWAKYDHVRTGTCLIRMSTIHEAGGQQAHLRISQDLEYWAYIATFGDWGFITQPHWLGKSSVYARKAGWFKKYIARRRLCPNIEQWQERVLPRLDDRQLDHFRTVRGRVASNYIQSKLIAGDAKEAWRMFHAYQDELPDNKLVRVLKTGHRLGWPGRIFTRYFIYYREWLKSIL